MEFIGKLGKYKIIETEDQTKTLWSEYFNEAFHNLSGAYAETFYNYIQGCHISDQIITTDKLHVLDVGFGLGVGLSALIDEIKKHDYKNKTSFSYVSMELDEDLFLWAIKTNFPNYQFIKIDNFYQSNLELSPTLKLNIRVFIGDGRITIASASKQDLLPKFTAIFQDAFSPNRNPTLWTTEWFETLKEISDTEVYMSTYSASVSIRKSMMKAGWKIVNCKGFGLKKTMTKARLVGITEANVAAELSRSPALELHDNQSKIK